jgi:hypothetical protein
MSHAFRGAIVAIVVLALLAGAFGAVLWARRGGTAANIAASALLLTFGPGLVANHPQRIPDQVKEERDKTGGMAAIHRPDAGAKLDLEGVIHGATVQAGAYG